MVTTIRAEGAELSAALAAVVAGTLPGCTAPAVPLGTDVFGVLPGVADCVAVAAVSCPNIEGLPL